MRRENKNKTIHLRKMRMQIRSRAKMKGENITIEQKKMAHPSTFLSRMMMNLSMRSRR